MQMIKWWRWHWQVVEHERHTLMRSTSTSSSSAAAASLNSNLNRCLDTHCISSVSIMCRPKSLVVATRYQLRRSVICLVACVCVSLCLECNFSTRWPINFCSHLCICVGLCLSISSQHRISVVSAHGMTSSLIGCHQLLAAGAVNVCLCHASLSVCYNFSRTSEILYR